jgi:hypothetical protein
MGIRVAEALKLWHLTDMATLKLDAPLAAILAQPAARSRESIIDVSVRTRAPLPKEQAAELSAIGVDGADTKRTIFPARMSREALRALASKPWVARVSLAQALRPLKAGGSRCR